MLELPISSETGREVVSSGIREVDSEIGSNVKEKDSVVSGTKGGVKDSSRVRDST